MKILLAVDDSQFSAAAVAAVAARPWPDGTIVRVLGAAEQIPPSAAELWYDAGGDLARVQQQLTKRFEAVTTRAAAELRAAGLTAAPVVRQGDPRSVIVDEAKDWSADLIVLGSHGYTGLKRWLLGSVAQSVVSHAPCSVEVVRAQTMGGDPTS